VKQYQKALEKQRENKTEVKKMPKCLQCDGELTHTVKSASIKEAIFVCINPICPNYGLLAICKEKMPKEKRGKRKW
jgi:hypothetical protein